MAGQKEESNICKFTFNAQPSKATIYVTGVQRSWNYLKLEFDRHSDGLGSPSTRYYQTLYAGPRLFAVDDKDQVYYHDQEKWIPFLTARDVKYSYDPDFTSDEDIPDDQRTIFTPQITSINAQWYFEDEVTVPVQSDDNDRWKPYEDIENEILEEAFQQTSEKPVLVELDDYLVDWIHLIQIKKSDKTKRQAIKRIMKCDDQHIHRIRTRFTDPLQLTTASSRSYGQQDEWCPFLKQWMETKAGKQCVFNVSVCVTKAVEGILIEGHRLGRDIQAKKLVKSLEMCQGSTIYEASKLCVSMYTRNTFLYSRVNEILRKNDSSKVDTLGPYCYLLRAYIRQTGTDYSGTLYRGCDLSKDHIDQYRSAAITKEWKTWTGFTSASKSPEVPVFFQKNTTFIINVAQMTMFLVRAFDIQSLSINSDEEEVLLPPGVLFQVLSVEDGQEKDTWIIKLKI